MAAVTAVARADADRDERRRRFPRRRTQRPRAVEATGPLPPLPPRLQIVRAALVVVLALAVALLLELAVLGRLQHRSAQDRAYDELRSSLARGTAPTGPADLDGRQWALGTPVALLEIPRLDLEQVVLEGTTPGVLFDGPGHRRDTPLPGQIGTSIVMGRRAAFGGPFAGLGRLEAGDEIVVTTGQGRFEYEVIGVRREGDPLPPALQAGESRLILATADGRAFVPDGVLRVDAALDGTAVGGVARAYTSSSLPDAEQLMGTDNRTLWALALWLQALIALAVGAIWSWHRWGRPHTWIVFTPALLFVGLGAMGEALRLLPNLM